MATRDAVNTETESVFHVLGLEDADDLRLRADLMTRILSALGDHCPTPGPTPAQVCGRLDLDPARAGDLLRGRITCFTTAQLLKYLADLGLDVELRITPAAEGRGRLHVA